MQNIYSVRQFSEDDFFAELAQSCSPDDIKSNARASYLAAYLTFLGAKTIVAEYDYVDADYLDDYASYYAKSFEHINRHCTRIHFFTSTFSKRSFHKAVVGGVRSTKLLRDSYLGFIVARPLPTATIGRTVLRTYPPDGSRRNYSAVRKYEANLFGIRLHVESLAYQEQDAALAACATVALWSCFQKTRDLFQSLAPTPVAITQAANKVLEQARPFPSRGLQIEQICNAIASVGLDPEVYHVTTDLPIVTLMYSYLSLGLPVLLVVNIPGTGFHALTVNGYSLRANIQTASEGWDVSKSYPPMIGRRIDEFYAHDDQVGPFSRLKIDSATASDPIVRLTESGWNQSLIPKAIIVPVYHKIRIGFREVRNWLFLISIVASWVSSAADSEWDIKLTSSNSFKEDVRSGEITVPPTQRNQVLLEGLPKYVWSCLLRVNGSPMLQVILDTTAMIKGFSVRRLWWYQEQAKSDAAVILNSPAHDATLTGLFGRRLLMMLRKLG